MAEYGYLLIISLVLNLYSFTVIRRVKKLTQQTTKEKLDFIKETLKELDLSHIDPTLRTPTKYSIESGGKHLRPLIIILCAEILGGDYRQTRNTFLALELIHNATLVHDDIIDEDLYRRGTPSVHSRYGVKKAVLTGDALLSMGLMYASKTKKPEIIHWLSETSLKMVQGITVQNQYKRKLISVEEYLYMNYLKSGSLFEAAGALGALSASNNVEDVANFSEFGKYFGNAYQIRDDIIDSLSYKQNEYMPNNDLMNGDSTLVFIYALESGKISNGDRKKLLLTYEKGEQEIDVHELYRIYEDSGALNKAILTMEEYSEKAGKILDKYPDSKPKSCLTELLNEYNSQFIMNLETKQLNLVSSS